jgi:hypothetical protein
LLTERLPRSAPTDSFSGQSKQVIETTGAPGRVAHDAL